MTHLDPHFAYASTTSETAPTRRLKTYRMNVYIQNISRLLSGGELRIFSIYVVNVKVLDMFSVLQNVPH